MFHSNRSRLIASESSWFNRESKDNTESYSIYSDLSSYLFGSRLSRIEAGAFFGTGLVEIILPSSGEIVGAECFSGCRSLYLVTFESGSRLSRIEAGAFFGTWLIEIIRPSSVKVLSEGCVSVCKKLSSVGFQ
jgi:hypothetical protein